MHLFDSTGVAIVSAFLTGVGALVFGGAFYYGIRDQIIRYRNANRQMATRNR
ncbi:putative photosystem I reaction center subunit XII [Kosakonia phage Kc263]|uniref:Photosystem I reaction center subunit XII n=1 Tax=Kosakonia phage Kc263 TaxID=2863194 RepID=A0AAE7WFC1_9CAUD|nr:putative photosystem I reaction center subunit XII [Kosakonia phage Kc263]QYN80027.1 putative photosystem I reaction center subunit XII [Kosakonia phage Kc263]